MIPKVQSDFPKTGFVRLSQIVGNKDAHPPIPAFIPVGRSTWWNWVRSGKAPAPVKLGPKTTAWIAEEIRDFATGLTAARLDQAK